MDQPMTTSSAKDLAHNLPKPPPKPKRKNPGNSGDSSRKRVSQACDTCRSKKLKSNGVRPTCSACVTQERECTYGTVIRKRGLPEGYVRGMEKLLGLFISKDEGGKVNKKCQEALTDEKAEGRAAKPMEWRIGKWGFASRSLES